MSVAFIIAEYRGREKTVLLERVEGEWEDAYRTTTSRRFSSLSKAQAAFLSELPKGSKELYEKRIAENSKYPRHI